MKLKLLCGILAVVLSSSCAVYVYNNNGTTPNIPLPGDADLISTKLERPAEGVPTDFTPCESLYIASGEIDRASSFRSEAKGSSVAMGVNQGVSSRRTVKDGNVYKQAVSLSSFVKLGEQRYVYNGNYLLRSAAAVSSLDAVKWENEAKKISKETYLARYGYVGDGLTGYILNDKTVKESQLVSSENGVYTYRYSLDTSVAPYFLCYEMKTSANTKALPVFSQAEITVTMDENFRVSSISTDCTYKVALLGGVNCHENITENFYDYGEVTELPEYEFFSEYFDAAIDDDVTGESDPLSILMDVFQPYLTGGKLLNLAFEAAIGETVLKGKISASLDMEALENTTVAISVGDLNLFYENGVLYVDYKDFKGSLSTDEIKDLSAIIVPFIGELPEIDTDSLLAGLSVTTDDKLCTINLPLNLGDLKAELNILAVKDGEKLVFDGASASVSGCEIKLDPINDFAVPERKGDYPSLAGLADLISDNKLSLKADIGGIGANISYDLAKNALYAKCGAGRLTVKDKTAYMDLGAAKLSAALSELPDLIKKFAPLFSDVSSALPEINVSDILSGINCTKTNDGVNFEINILGIKVSAALTVTNGRWQLKQISAVSDKFGVNVLPSTPFENVVSGKYVDAVSVADAFYSPVAALLSAKTFSAEIFGAADFGTGTADFSASVKRDTNGNLYVGAVIGDGVTSFADINAYLFGSKIYLSFNGLNFAFDTKNFGITDGFTLPDGVTEALCEKSDVIKKLLESLENIIYRLQNLRLSDVDFGAVIEALSFEDGKLSADINADEFGLGKFAINLSAGGKLAARVEKLSLGGITLDVSASVNPLENVMSEPSAEDYLTELKLFVLGNTVKIKADLMNMRVFAAADTAVGKVNAELNDGVIYLVYGGARMSLKLSDLGEVASYLKDFIELPKTGQIDTGKLITEAINNFDVNKAVGGILTLSTEIANVKVNLAFDLNGEIPVFDKLEASVNEVTIEVTKSFGGDYEEISFLSGYVDIFELLKTFAPAIGEILNADGQETELAFQIRLGNNLYGVKGTMNLLGGISGEFYVSYNGLNALKAEITAANGFLFANVNGIKIKIPLGAADQTAFDIFNTLDSVKGLGEQTDELINVVENVLNAFYDGKINYASLIKALTFKDGVLKLTANGSAFEISEFDITLSAEDKLSVTLDKLYCGSCEISGAVSLCGSDKIVEMPKGDYTTDIAVKIDALNTVYGNLDFVSNIYRFRLGDLNVMYDGNAFYIGYDGVRVKGNIEELKDIINRLKELSDKTFKTVSALPELSLDFDVKALLRGIEISADAEKNRVYVNLNIFGVELQAEFLCGVNPLLNKITAPISAIGKTLEISFEESARDYDSFGQDETYVDISSVFNEYFPVLESLVQTQGWRFAVCGEFGLNGAKYLLGEDSFVEFAYVSQTDFDLKAYLNISKATLNGGWENFVTLDVAYTEDRLYLDYNGLKFTVGKDAINRCAGLIDDLLNAVPQLKQLAEDMKNASKEVSDNKKLIDYSTLLRTVDFTDGVFNTVINGNIFLSELCDIDLTFFVKDGALALLVKDFVYGDVVTVPRLSLSVKAENYDDAMGVIGVYDKNAYNNLDSLYELLSAFIVTANNNSFCVEGQLNAKLVVDVDVNLAVNVDINEKGQVFVAVKIAREKLGSVDLANIAFVDYGGNGYIYYDGADDTIRVMRDSYTKHWWCSKYNVWNCSAKYDLFKHNTTFCHSSEIKLDSEVGSISYDSGIIPSEKFTQNIMDYLLPIVNFKGWINDEIYKAANGSSGSSEESAKIEKILKSYSYSENDKKFTIAADLTPLDSMLGDLTVGIAHNENYVLTNLTGEMSLLKNFCKLTLNLALKQPVYNTAITYVSNYTLW